MFKRLIIIPLLFVIAEAQSSEAVFTKPKQFSFGIGLEKVKLNLTSLCTSLKVKKITPITAPLANKTQEQINCSGFMYGGKKRDVELVFQDDQLDIVWILFPKEEKQTFITNFKALYGDPSMSLGYGDIFLQANAAIRNEPSEVLFASNRQVKAMMNILKKQQAQLSKK